MSNDQGQTIIIKKVQKKSGGAHSSAWKVAYADFVSALLALFIVLWILGQSEQVKEMVAAYFSDPISFSRNKSSSGTLPGQQGILPMAPIVKRKIPSHKEESNENMKKKREEARARLEKALQSLPFSEKFQDQIKVELNENQALGTYEQNGVRVQFQDRENREFFKTGSDTPTPEFIELLKVLTEELASIPSDLVIEGYADSRPYLNRKDYSNWDLSFDRANSVRKIMSDQGVNTDRFTEIRGYGDRRLVDPEHPENPKNRRVSVILLMK